LPVRPAPLAGLGVAKTQECGNLYSGARKTTPTTRRAGDGGHYRRRRRERCACRRTGKARIANERGTRIQMDVATRLAIAMSVRRLAHSVSGEASEQGEECMRRANAQGWKPRPPAYSATLLCAKHSARWGGQRAECASDAGLRSTEREAERSEAGCE
jgi:hypothetical protein